MMTEEHLADRFAGVASSYDDSDWTDVCRRARTMRRRRVAPVVMLAAVLLFAAPAVAFQEQVTRLFVQGEAPPPNEPTITSMFGEEPIGLGARMSDAEAAAPYQIQCSAGTGASLMCTEISGDESLAALKRGETVYGRTVIGIPGGAKAGATEAAAHFEPTDLICPERRGDSLVCFPVTQVQPTIREGVDVFAFYKRHNVTFTEKGNAVEHIGEPTISFNVIKD
jgi:hypothetical protein